MEQDFLKKNWFKVGLLSILAIFVAGLFYWLAWRPVQIKLKCSKEATFNMDYYEKLRTVDVGTYENCLRRLGL